MQGIYYRRSPGRSWTLVRLTRSVADAERCARRWGRWMTVGRLMYVEMAVNKLPSEVKDFRKVTHRKLGAWWARTFLVAK